MGFPQITIGNRTIGGSASWLLLTAIVLWLGGGAILREKVGWPEHYGFQCHGRGCMIDEMGHSLALVRQGGFLPDLLFIDIWSIFAIPLALFAWTKLRRRPDNLETTSYISDPE
ncbi:hypothetical protein U1839_10305 [Sphingomonas sp. RT2P30]|uniref:hypothetical protein n=1 Tax=Parasphingomonas halimpatiens TaxID=3096162 RepID=UPI002FC85EEE